MLNPFRALNEAVEAIDDDTRQASGKCSQCGRDRGGVLMRGQTKEQANLCTCELDAGHPPTTILDTRVPQPGEYVDYGVPPDIAAQAYAYLQERNTCSDARVEEIDATLLTLLRPWTRG